MTPKLGQSPLGVLRSPVNESEEWALKRVPDGEANRYISARREILASLPKTSNSDLGEMTVAANATGLMPDIPLLHLPVIRISEIPEVLSPVEEGGILETRGAIDIVTCLRATDEAGLGGGVYIVVSCEKRLFSHDSDDQRVDPKWSWLNSGDLSSLPPLWCGNPDLHPLRRAAECPHRCRHSPAARRPRCKIKL